MTPLQQLLEAQPAHALPPRKATRRLLVDQRARVEDVKSTTYLSRRSTLSSLWVPSRHTLAPLDHHTLPISLAALSIYGSLPDDRQRRAQPVLKF